MADDEAKARIKQLKRVDEAKALKSDAFSRTASQRQTAKTYIEEIVAETRVSRAEKSFLFSESQYITWYGLNEGLTQDAGHSEVGGGLAQRVSLQGAGWQQGVDCGQSPDCVEAD